RAYCSHTRDSSLTAKLARLATESTTKTRHRANESASWAGPRGILLRGNNFAQIRKIPLPASAAPFPERNICPGATPEARTQRSPSFLPIFGIFMVFSAVPENGRIVHDFGRVRSELYA